MISEDFYKLDVDALKSVLKEFVSSSLFVALPELRAISSVIVVGSVARVNHDSYSDVDIKIITSSDTLINDLMPRFREYKASLRQSYPYIQLHNPETYNAIEHALSSWEEDSLLREYSGALIIEDAQEQFLKIKEKFKYYPEEIYKEKIDWLYAELVLAIEERLKVAVIRGDFYYSQVMKQQIIRIYMNLLLMLSGRYTAFDKHLHKEVKEIFPEDVELFEKLLVENNLNTLLDQAKNIKEDIEKKLITKGLISKNTDQYWLDRRTRYQVKLG